MRGATLKSHLMRRPETILAAGVLALALASSAFAADDPPPSSAPVSSVPASSAPISCGNGIPGGISCIVTKKGLKEGRNAYVRGVKLQDHQKLEEALAKFDEASRLVPQNPQFLTAREMVKARLAFNHIQQGNILLAENLNSRAAVEFRSALDLNPDDEFARERLVEATRELIPADASFAISTKIEDSGEIRVQPKNERASFHFRGDVRGLFAEIGSAYGITSQFDDSVVAKQVRFTVDDVDFFTALRLACQVSKTMWTAMDAHQIMIAPDTPENHRQFDRLSLRTFILPAHSTPQEATDLVTTLRNMFDLRFVSSGQTANTVEVRAPQATIEACTRLMAQLGAERPQIMLDVQVFQINHQLTRNIGVHVPNTFTMYNIPAIALAGLGGLGGQNIQQLINQLISSGGINQAGSTGIAGLLSQLGGQSSNIFSTPLATFGGGLTFMGLSLDQFAAMLSLNESWVRSLEHMTMRASQGNDATFHLGSRYPVTNATFSPISNSPQISAVLGNQSYIPPVPSISYEDLGLNLKAKPTVHGDGAVSLQLELQVRSLTGQANNGVPVISNREYKGSINLKDGEPAVVAGEMSRTDQLSMSGIPGLGFVPGLNQAMVNNTREEDTDELMIVITPHILSTIERDTPEIWISEK
jgi:general secretion pathway protein D